MRGSTAAWAALLVAGCATSPTTLQTARTVEAEELRLHAGGSIPITTQFIGALADTIDSATERAEMAEMAGRPLTAEEEAEVSEGAMGLVLFVPAPVFELGARFAPVERFDIGFEWAGPMLRGDLKLQIVADQPIDLAALAGYTFHTSTGVDIQEGLNDLFQFALVVDYGRHDVDLAVLASSDPRETVSWYGAVRYMASFVSLNIDVGWGTMRTLAESSSVMHTIGGVIGLRAGTEKLAVMLELTVAYIHFAPELESEGTTRELGLSGVLFMPALGLSFETG